MDMREQVQEWAAGLGYTGKISKTFQNMCNPRNAHIWQQLLDTVKPKAEVQKVRYNVLMHHIKNPSEVNDLLYPPLREMEMWEKKCKLEEQIKYTKEHITANNQRVNHLSTKNKIKYLQIDNAKEKIEETRMKTFLLETKAAALKEDLAEAQEKLDICKSLTPEPEMRNKCDVLDTLNKCAEKMEDLIKKQDFDTCQLEFEDMLPETNFNETQLACDFEDEQLLKDVKDLLHDNDNRLVWDVLLESVKVCSNDLKSCINKELEQRPKYEENSNAINILNAKFIENELETMLIEKNIEKLQLEVENQEKESLKQMDLQTHTISDAEELILLQREEAKVKASYEFMSLQVEFLKSSTNSRLELTEELKKSIKLQQKIVDIFRSMDRKMNIFKQIHSNIVSMREEIPKHLLKLRLLIDDLQWAQPLADNVTTKEICVFNKFCIEENRQVTPKLIHTVTDWEDLDSNSLHVLAALIDNPFNATETILLNIFKEKMWLKALKSIADVEYTSNYKKYDFEDLRRQEGYINEHIGKLKSIMKPSVVNSVVSFPAKTKQTMKLWLEMPMKDFVNKKNQFEGHDFNYYQNLFDSCYNKLQ